MSYEASALQRAPSAFALSLVLAIAACGGGSGGTEDDTAEATGSHPTPFLVAQAPANCPDSNCQMVHAALLDNDGNASLLWRVLRSGTSDVLHAAAHAPGAAAVGRAAEFALGSYGWRATPLAAGNQRVAVVEPTDSGWTSVVMDMSPASGPTVTPRVTLPVPLDAQFVTTLHDGVFVVGPMVPRATLDMGGGTTAQGTPVPLPAGYRNLHWGQFAPLWGAPSAWWVFNAIQTGGTEQRLYLSLVDLTTGAVRDTEDLMGTAWSPNNSNTYHCEPVERQLIDVNDYGQRRAVAGWMQRKATANQGCDIVVNRTTLTAATSSASSRPVLGGSATGQVALWQESDLAQADQSSRRYRIVWRALDARSGTWSEETRLSTHPHAWITGQISAPDGLMAISWLGCDGPEANNRCTGYLTKYVRGVWTTVEMGMRSPSSPFDTKLAINIHGDAMAVWARSLHDGCQSGRANNSGAACSRIYGHRF